MAAGAAASFLWLTPHPLAAFADAVERLSATLSLDVAQLAELGKAPALKRTLFELEAAVAKNDAAGVISALHRAPKAARALHVRMRLQQCEAWAVFALDDLSGSRPVAQARSRVLSRVEGLPVPVFRIEEAPVNGPAMVKTTSLELRTLAEHTSSLVRALETAGAWTAESSILLRTL